MVPSISLTYAFVRLIPRYLRAIGGGTVGLATAVAAPFALLLVVSGVEKLRAPGATRDALALVGVPAHPLLLVGLPAGEIAVAVVFFSFGGPWSAAPLFLVYAAFGVVVARELRRGSGSGCGCFGEASSGVTRFHLGVDIAGALAAAGAVATVGPAPLAALLGMGWLLPLVTAAIVTVTVLLRALLADLPPLLELARPQEAHP